jgi:hypothetical protein
MPDFFMSSQELQFLNLRNLLARLHAEEVTWLLGFKPYDIPILVADGLLKPLRNPPTTGVKYFATTVIEEHCKDARWLARASDCVVQHWQTLNRKRKSRAEISQSGTGSL